MKTNCSPLRRLSWRADRAYRLVAEGRRGSPTTDDPVTLQLTEFLRQSRACTTESGRRRLRRKHPGKTAAVAMYEDRDCEKRCAVAAWILAREPDREIADACGMVEQAITFYRQFFFDLTDRWCDHSFILTHTTMAHCAGVADEDVAFRHFAWKIVGYLGGGAPLKDLMLMPGSPLRDLWRSTRDLFSGVLDAARTGALCDLIRRRVDLSGAKAASLKELENAIARMPNSSTPRNLLQRVTLGGSAARR